MADVAELVVVSALESARGGLACGAALAWALAGLDHEPCGVAFVERRAGRTRGATLLASNPARRLESELGVHGFQAAARGRVTWVALDPELPFSEAVAVLASVASAAGARFVVVHASPEDLRGVLAASPTRATAVIRVDLPRAHALASLLARELRADRVAVRLAIRAPGVIATRRALSGVDPGGAVGRRSTRLARGIGAQRRDDVGRAFRSRLASELGQSAPLVLSLLVALIACTLVLAAFGGAVSGASRAQRVADLAALSAARSMRDDFDRLFIPARLANGAPNPVHLDKRDYLARATAAAREAAARNGVALERIRIEFPDGDALAPLRVRAELTADLEAAGEVTNSPLEVYAEAEAAPPATAPPAAAVPAIATGGGYSGTLVYRQGEGMRPDVAVAFDRMAAAAARAGISLLVNSGFRSDAEQAALFAENPDPRMVAPPGTSLHRCATELDLGPSAAYGWLAANAGRFGFIQRYSWEAWHYGFTGGPQPCSAAGDAGTTDGAVAEISLPDFVPDRFRAAIAAAAQRWNVSSALLAAQLMAESNFNPFAVSPAGAAGIAQFMPGTAAMYGLTDRFDPEASIEAQAHLMADLLEQFSDPALALAAYNAGPGAVAPCSCVPAIPETQAYVARILGLMGGAGAIATPPTLEVRLVD